MTSFFAPNHIFKFSSIDKYIYQNIILQRLWFNCPALMNDQFEGFVTVENDGFKPSNKATINFLNSVDLNNKDSIAHIERHGFVDFYMRYSLHVETQKYGLSSFSRSYFEPLLWAHYADKNKGVCLVYDEGLLYEHLSTVIPVIQQKEISYNQKPIIRLSEENSKINFHSNMEFLCSKHSNWKYEKETRFYFKNNEVFTGESFVIGAQPLKAIIYGYRTLSSDKQAFSDLLSSDDKYKHVKEYEVNIDYSESKFHIVSC